MCRVRDVRASEATRTRQETADTVTVHGNSILRLIHMRKHVQTVPSPDTVTPNQNIELFRSEEQKNLNPQRTWAFLHHDSILEGEKIFVPGDLFLVDEIHPHPFYCSTAAWIQVVPLLTSDSDSTVQYSTCTRTYLKEVLGV